MFITLKRIIRSGFKTFIRNGFLSASSIVVIVITMLIILGIFFASILMKASIAQLENKVDINIYFKAEAPTELVQEFKEVVFKLPEVDQEKSNFMSRKKVLELFQARHKKNAAMLEALDIVDDNPFGATLNIKAKKLGEYSGISDFIDDPDVFAKYGAIIENLNYNQNKKAIEKLNILVDYIYRFGLIISAILILISIIVTFNTMRLIIHSFREEISIMRLVGASKFFARGPFIIEGIIYGVISGIIALGITWLSIAYFSPMLKEIFILDLEEYFNTNILEIAGALILGGIVLGFISTYIAVSRYLKV